MMSSRVVWGMFVSTVLVQPVLAQPPPPPPPPSTAASVAPAESGAAVLPNMLSHELGGSIDARLDYTNGAELFEELTLIAINLHGQYISPGGLGGYIALPLYYADGDGDSDSGTGNIELGGLYVMPQGPATSILLRGGLSLDTAGEAEGFLAPFANIAPRLQDYVTSGLDTTWLRGQAALRHDANGVIFGVSAGLDLPIEGAATEGDGFDGLINLAASVGVQQPGFGAGVGLVMLQALTDSEDDENILGLNATVDFPVGPTTRMFGALGLNLEDDIGDLWSIGVGARFAIR